VGDSDSTVRDKEIQRLIDAASQVAKMMNRRAVVDLEKVSRLGATTKLIENLKQKEPPSS